MNTPIQNASLLTLDECVGTLPSMQDALLDWFQPMVFTMIEKQVINFQNVEIPTNIDFRGVWQPFTDQMLEMKPHGQRSWSWFMLHSDPTLSLNPDDVVTYLNNQFRVMSRRDYTQYQYIEYHLVLDYSGSGPNAD